MTQVSRCNGRTGQFIDDYVLDDSLDGVAFTFAPDGDLYIAGVNLAGQGVVARYLAASGEYAGDFVPPGSFTPSAPAFVTFMPASGLMLGAGVLEEDDIPQLFAFYVLSSKGEVRGRFRALLIGDLEDQFELKFFSSTAITGAAFWDDPGITPGRRGWPTRDTIAFCGTGEFAGDPVAFEARMSDAGEPGASRDYFRLRIWSPPGTPPIEPEESPRGFITRGNIQSVAEWWGLMPSPRCRGGGACPRRCCPPPRIRPAGSSGDP